METPQLQAHVFSTYNCMRVGIAVLAIAFPVVLLLVGLCIDVSVQNSISAYYHTRYGVQVNWAGGLQMN